MIIKAVSTKNRYTRYTIDKFCCDAFSQCEINYVAGRETCPYCGEKIAMIRSDIEEKKWVK